MINAIAQVKFVRMSPRKTRLVTDLLKGKTVEEAIFILDSINKRVAGPVKKVVNSAFSNINFERQEKFLERDVLISRIQVDGGPYLMRYKAATMGRATPVRHRTTHLKVELEAEEIKKPKAEKKPKTAKKPSAVSRKPKTAKGTK